MSTGRYAPSPSGRMHLGNLMCCLLAWLSAKSKGGQVLLRIEDLDTQRCPRSYADAIVDDLAWLGLAADGPTPPVYQSDRSEIYQRYFDELSRRGLVYPCFCSRSQLHAASAPHRSDGQVIYAGTCRGLTPAEIAERSKIRAPAWRVQVPDEVIAFEDGHMGHYEENLARDCGDFFLRRADGVFAYQLAVVVDDALMGVDEVVRGSDLLSSTPRQLWLYRKLGLTPPKFYHLPLLLASDGRRLSKRDGDQSLENLREKYTPEEIIGKLAFACGLQASPPPTTPQALAAPSIGPRFQKATSFCRKICFNKIKSFPGKLRLSKKMRSFLSPSARGSALQAVGERTVRLPEIFRAMARFSPSAPSGHLPRRGRFFDSLGFPLGEAVTEGD